MYDEVPGPVRAAIVADFLRRSRQWATDKEIPKLLSRMANAPTSKDAAKLYQWTTWCEFIDHAQRELDDGTLDHWFSDPFTTPDR